MRFLFENREKIDKLDSHDGMFEGYSFDSEKRTISMSWMHGFEKNKRVHLRFNHVIYSEMQSYEMWKPDVNLIYFMWHVDDSPQMKKMKEIIDADKIEYPHSYKEVNYIQVIIKIQSGDELTIICESMDWEEEII